MFNHYLSVNFDHGLAMARVNLVTTVSAQTDPVNMKNTSLNNTLTIALHSRILI